MKKIMIAITILASLFLLAATPVRAKIVIEHKVVIKSPHAKEVEKAEKPVAKKIVTAAPKKAIRVKALANTGGQQPIPTVAADKGYVEARIREVFGVHAERALAIARCESGLRSNALNVNRNKTTDKGIFQLNSVHKKRLAGRDPFDPEVNIQVAHEIFQEQGFGPWVCNRKI
jgi:hypothetical protein